MKSKPSSDASDHEDAPPEAAEEPRSADRSTRSGKKQAVVLIHGIGEQVPMETLRGFVETVWSQDSSLRNKWNPDQVWSKPDEESRNYELRRLTTAENRQRRRTDFFELYWADLMQDTKVSHVWAWARVLLFRSPGRVPRPLRALWWFLWVVGIGSLGLYLCTKFELLPGFHRLTPWITAAGALAWFVAGGFIVNVAGDAARYLHVAPPNIASRRNIRQAGIDLLTRLHDSGQYDRIILVGHSLGSVIGYDILTCLWPRYNEASVSRPSRQPSAALLNAEAMADEAADYAGFGAQFQAAQDDCFDDLRSQGNPWLVTDFVTLGSPLAHAPMLMARDWDQLRRKQTDREFPTCPPQLETVEKQRRFSFHSGAGGWVLHHAAVFAVTRWTNLYFPAHHTLWGDLIGGPLAPVFGHGIRDVPVHTTLRRGLLSHTLYWTVSPQPGKTPTNIAALRQALRLCV